MEDGLLTELKNVRKGRGVYAPHIEHLIGPRLRACCDISGDDNPAEMRQKLIAKLSAWASALPADLGLAVSAALGLHPDARQPFLAERIAWLADKIERDDRTARRRVDDGIVQLAEIANRRPQTPARPLPGPAESWYVEDFNAVLLLDRGSPQAIERRRIVAERDGIDVLTIAIGLPRDPARGSEPRDLAAEVIYGGILAAKHQRTASQFRYQLQLPRKLRVGERHEYAVVFRIPENQPMRTHYVYTSPRRCDHFDLRVRFDRDRLPQRVWRVSRLFHRELDENSPSGDELTPDAAGEIHVEFTDLAPGFGYGAQWSG